MPTWTFKMQTTANLPIEKKVEVLENTIVELLKRLSWITSRLDSKNIKRISSSETDIDISLTGLADVTITSAANNEVLAYDTGAAEWINQTAAEAGLVTTTDLSSHEDDTTNVHGIADTSALETTTGAQDKVNTHNEATTGVHGITDTANVDDAVTKRHSQNTDTGTNQNTFAIGDGTDTTILITANNADTDKPGIRYNASTNVWERTNDGTTWASF